MSTFHFDFVARQSKLKQTSGTEFACDGENTAGRHVLVWLALRIIYWLHSRMVVCQMLSVFMRGSFSAGEMGRQK